jgi:hypothetical protein
MNGNNTIEIPCLITNCTQLQNMNLNLTGHFALDNDINCSDTVNWNSGQGFDPVGNSTNYPNNLFIGTFDGRNHTITGLYINRSSTQNVGLFGYTYTGAEIKNVGLEDVNITGDYYVGGLVGQAPYTKIIRSYTTGNVYGAGPLVGGLAGHLAQNEISDCYSTCNVKGTYDIGGLVGRNYLGNIINNSYATGNVNATIQDVGGLVGDNSGNISNSFSTGNVSYNASQYPSRGGLVGYNSGSYEIVNCYWNNKTGNPSHCWTDTFGNSSDGCTAIPDNEPYFFNVNSPPMANWSYPPWDDFCHNKGYMPLEWENITNVSECREYTILPPIYTEFENDSRTTNFSDVPDLTNVTNMTLANQYGRIHFPADYGVDASGEDYDANIEIGDNFISVDTPELHSTFNASVNLTLNNVNCPIIIYYGAGVYTTAQDIINEGNICNESSNPSCTNINCTNNILNFTVSHFTGFASGPTTNLIIWDETDSGMPFGDQTKYPSDNVKFFANYTNATGVIQGANCIINFSDGSANMSWNSSGFYEYNRSFSSFGVYDWNVTCNKTGYNTLTANDTVTITPPQPKCGNTITTDTTLTEHLKNSTNGTICPGHGLIIGANDIVLDCQGYNITGDGGSGDYGINITGYNNKYNWI